MKPQDYHIDCRFSYTCTVVNGVGTMSPGREVNKVGAACLLLEYKWRGFGVSGKVYCLGRPAYECQVIVSPPPHAHTLC